MRRYQDVPAMTRDEAEAFLMNGTEQQLCKTLVSIALHDPDWQWVQARCLHFARHQSAAVRSVAALSLGHLARIHRVLDADAVLPVLHELARTPDTRGQAEDALDDIRIFLSAGQEIH